MMKKKLIYCVVFSMLFLYGLGKINFNLRQGINHVMLSNIEALAGGEEGEFPRYINITDKSSNTEFRTEVSVDGVKIEYKRTCSTYTTYCKNTGDKEDICYEELNGVTTTCDSWQKES